MALVRPSSRYGFVGPSRGRGVGTPTGGHRTLPPRGSVAIAAHWRHHGWCGRTGRASAWRGLAVGQVHGGGGSPIGWRDVEVAEAVARQGVPIGEQWSTVGGDSKCSYTEGKGRGR
jgi:hypothetical protein